MALPPDITAKNADDRELIRAVQGPPTAPLIGTDRKKHRAEEFLGRLGQAHKG